MKWLLVAAIAAGCSQPHDDGCIDCSPPPQFDECTSDLECQPDVCARDHACHPVDDVRRVAATWMIFGHPANATTCMRAPDLYIRFHADDGSNAIGFAPVPCHLGQFLLDKAPLQFDRVELGVDGFATDVNGGFGAQIKPVDATGSVAFDMQI